MKILNEETQYHHGSFKDLQTFLDKNGNPYTLIKSEQPQSKSNGNGKSSNNQNNQNQSNTQSNKQNQSQNQQNNQNQSQNNQKVLPDPNASYVDVNTGSEYRWDPDKNQFIRVGKYHAK